METKRHSFVGGTKGFFLRKSMSSPEVYTPELYAKCLTKEYKQWKMMLRCKTDINNYPKVSVQKHVKDIDILYELNEDDRRYFEDASDHIDTLNTAKRHTQWVILSKGLESDFNHTKEILSIKWFDERQKLIDDLLINSNSKCNCDYQPYCTRQLHPLITSMNPKFYESIVPPEERIK